MRAIDVVRDVLGGFPGPVMLGLPSGHTTTPLVSLPLGVTTRVIAAPPQHEIIIEESAASE